MNEENAETDDPARRFEANQTGHIGRNRGDSPVDAISDSRPGRKNSVSREFLASSGTAAKAKTSFPLAGRWRSFGHAFRGGVALVRTQPNARIHLAATVAVIALGVGFRVSRVDWALLSVAVALVWMAEALNTAIESLADEVTLERRERIKRAKDVGAFGVFIAAATSLVIGAIVFGPHLLK